MTCEGDVPATTTDGATWADVAADLSQSTSLELTFKDVEFDAGSLSRALGLLSSVPGAGSVAASLQRCGMSDQQAAVAASARVPGSRQLALTLDRCEFYGNSLNLTGALAAQAGLDVTLKVLDSSESIVVDGGVSIRRGGSGRAVQHQTAPPASAVLHHCAVVEGNRLLAMGAAAAGTTARADIQVADGSSVDRNTVDLLGALAARGDGSLAIQLAASNVTRNKLSGGGLVALGGAGAADVAENGAVVTGNENEARIRVVTENRLATKALDIVLGVGELAGRAGLARWAGKAVLRWRKAVARAWVAGRSPTGGWPVGHKSETPSHDRIPSPCPYRSLQRERSRPIRLPARAPGRCLRHAGLCRQRHRRCPPARRAGGAAGAGVCGLPCAA